MNRLKNVTAAAVAFLAVSSAFAAKPAVSNEKVEQAINEITDTSDFYISNLDRRGDVTCSAEVEVDNKVFSFRVDNGRDDSEIEIEFDKVTSRVVGNSTQVVRFTKLKRNRNSLRIEFVVDNGAVPGLEFGVLVVKLRREGRYVTGGRVTLHIGNRNLSCDGNAS